MRTRQTVAHRPDCPAMLNVERGGWDTPWYFPGGFRGIKGYVMRDSLGRRTRGMGELWLVLRCNAHDRCRCGAEMLVALNDILTKVPNGR
jgi:hypothetical protein